MSSAIAAAMPHPPNAGGIRRRLFLALGVLSVALGVVGIVVPGLPTTVFLLAASWLFARSSPRFHRRLLDSPLGAYLRRAHEGGMPTRAIVLSLVAMWSGIAFAALVPGAGRPALQAILLGLGGVGTAAIGWVAARSRPSANVRPLAIRIGPG
jgi:hypothetical protein